VEGRLTIPTPKCLSTELQLVNISKWHLYRSLAYNHESKPCEEEYTSVDIRDGVEKRYRLGLLVDGVDFWRLPEKSKVGHVGYFTWMMTSRNDQRSEVNLKSPQRFGGLVESY
jgi:hypothetical protein